MELADQETTCTGEGTYRREIEQVFADEKYQPLADEDYDPQEGPDMTRVTTALRFVLSLYKIFGRPGKGDSREK